MAVPQSKWATVSSARSLSIVTTTDTGASNWRKPRIDPVLTAGVVVTLDARRFEELDRDLHLAFSVDTLVAVITHNDLAIDRRAGQHPLGVALPIEEITDEDLRRLLTEEDELSRAQRSLPCSRAISIFNHSLLMTLPSLRT